MLGRGAVGNRLYGAGDYAVVETRHFKANGHVHLAKILP